MAQRGMPATGILLILIAIWILINLFVGDLPKLVMGKAGINFTPTPIPNPTPNPVPTPTPTPNPDPLPWNVGPVEGTTDSGSGNTGCPPGYMNVFGMCVPITPIPKGKPPAGNPVPLPRIGVGIPIPF